MSVTQHLMTAQELLEAPDLGRCELLCGELRMMSPAGFEHGRVAGQIHGCLAEFVKSRGLGLVLSAETGYWIGHDPDTVRAPDVAFVAANRVPPSPALGFFEGAPDLTVEVLSPDDRPGEVVTKVQDWLRSGCKAVWVVDPATRTVVVHQPAAPPVRLGPGDVLTGEDFLPGFHLRVAEIFA